MMNLRLILLIIISTLFILSLEVEYEVDVGGGQKIKYKAKFKVDEDLLIEEGEFTSSNSEETIFLVVDGAKLTLGEAVTIKKDTNSNSKTRRNLLQDLAPPEKIKYGINSAIVVVGKGSKASLNGVTITTNEIGAHGVFAINSGEIEIYDSTITTLSDDSKGLLGINDSKITGDNNEILTKGNLSPCIQIEGIITASSMTLYTEGNDSPLIYSLGLATFSSSNGNAKQSQISIIEGPHSLTFNGCEFSCMGKGRPIETENEDDDVVGNAGILIFTEVGTNKGMSNFESLDTTLIIEDNDNKLKAPMIFIVNSLVVINFEHSTLTSKSGVIFETIGHSDVNINAQKMGIVGDIVAKGISTINLKYDCNTLQSSFKKEGSVNAECL